MLSPIRLDPTEGGTDEFSDAFGGCPCRAFNFATSGVNSDPMYAGALLLHAAR